MSGRQGRYGTISRASIAVVAAVLLTGLCQVLNAQPSTVEALYSKAEALYNADDPTTDSDLEAVGLYTWVGSNTAASSTLRIESYLKAGNLLMGQQLYDSSNRYYHQVLQLNQRTLRKGLYDYEGWLFLGTSMYYSGTFDSARLYFEKAALVAEKYKQSIDLPEQDRLYNSLGVLYFEAANYQQAKNHFVTALSSVSPRAQDKQEFYTTIQSNIANSLLKLKQYDSAIMIFKGLRPVKAQEQLVAQNLANAYFEKGNLSAAQNIYSNLQSAQVKLSPAALNNLGRIYTAAQRYTDAAATLQQALQTNEDSKATLKTKERALTYLYLSELSKKMGLPEEAIDYSNQALVEVFYNFRPGAKGDLPADVTQTIAPLTAFQILLYKARLQMQRYRQQASPNALWNAHRSYIKTLDLLNYITLNLDNDEARMFFLDNASTLFDEAVWIAYLMYKQNPSYAEDFVFILESYKGSLLKNNLTQLEQKAARQLPDGLLEKEKSLKELYAVYLTRLGNTTDADARQKLQSRISYLQVELAQLQRNMQGLLRQAHAGMGERSDQASIRFIRQNLPAGTAIVNYYIGQSGIYILALSRGKVQLQHITTGAAFQQAFASFSQAHKLPNDGQRYSGSGAAHTLYQYLLAPVADVVQDANHLILVPDGFLFQLSFEALSPRPGARNYLLLSKAISYQYSMQLLLQGRPADNMRATASVLALAPFASGAFSAPAWAGQSEGMNLAILPHTRQETNLPMALQLLDSLATKGAFLKYYARHNILHLATHASLGSDSNTNWIQFFPQPNQDGWARDRLYVQEIYNLNLSHRPLVLLSACEGANGLMANGEGLLSLSRAFLYAGAGGVISTLYKTDDYVTAIIVNRLYHYLQKGYLPGEALRQAKVDFLDADTISPRLKNPAYWSNFIFTGYTMPARRVGAASVARMLGVGVGALGVAGVVFLALHYRRSRRAVTKTNASTV